MLATENGTEVGFDFACFLDGGMFFVDELKISIRRQVNTQNIDAVSTSHLHLNMSELTLAQKHLAYS